VSSIDFDLLRKYTTIPPVAEQLLSRPEREIHFDLTLKIASERVLRAPCYVFYFNTVRGPAKGGIRFDPSVTIEETRDLAERMVWKTALSRIPFGGGKSGIRFNPKDVSRFEKTAIIKEFVHMISLELEHGMYLPAPDMGTNATDMAVIFGELHLPECVTGKPPRVGGLPGRREATGRGVSHAALLAIERVLRKKPGEATAAVQGFGNVGGYTALRLHEAGVRVVALSDHTGGRLDPAGLDVPALFEYALQNGVLEGSPGRKISNEELLAMDVDVLAPCAREDQIARDNAADVRASVIVEGANGPTTAEADAILNERRVPVVPDILANCGGVVASYVEWRQGKSGAITEKNETFATVEDRIGLAFRDMLEVAGRLDVPFRMACQISAGEELVASLRDRDWI